MVLWRRWCAPAVVAVAVVCGSATAAHAVGRVEAVAVAAAAASGWGSSATVAQVTADATRVGADGGEATSGPTSERPSAQGRYIVRFEDGVSTRRAATAAGALGVRRSSTYTDTFRGFAAELTSAQVAQLRADPTVASVTQDRWVHVTGSTTVKNPRSWGLDRIDQPGLPLSKTYTYDPDVDGSGVYVYVLDTGLNSASVDLQANRAAGYNAVPATYEGDGGVTVSDLNAGNTSETEDCAGHGTHVSGTVAGATYGVAKGATIVPVRVLTCDGWALDSWIVDGIDWVVAQQEAHPNRLAVANISIGGEGDAPELNAAVKRLVTAGVPTAVAAGNDGVDACTESPSRVPTAVTVGATLRDDGAAGFSNFGSCLDLYAPGADITSDWVGSATATATLSGTSMASPHVAGAMALLRQAYPDRTAAEISALVVSEASTKMLHDMVKGSGDPNRMLQVEDSDTTAPTMSALTLTAGPSRVTVKATAADTGSGVQGLSYTLDHSAAAGTVNSSVEVRSTTATIAPVATGRWYVHVRAVDNAGHVTAVRTAGPVTVDGTAPKIAKATVTTKKLKVTMKIKASDAQGRIASYQLVASRAKKVTSAAVRTGGTKATITKTLKKGTWYLHARVTDKAGNVTVKYVKKVTLKK